jgi:hypothetical protein
MQRFLLHDPEPFPRQDLDRWQECFEQVLFPMVTSGFPDAPRRRELSDEDVGLRRAQAAGLVCRVVLQRAPEWLKLDRDRFTLVFFRLVHTIAKEVTKHPDVVADAFGQSLRSLLLVLGQDPGSSDLVEKTWTIAASAFPALREEVEAILGPVAAAPAPVSPGWPGPDGNPEASGSEAPEPTRITLEKRGARALGFEVGLASGVDLKVEAVLPDGLLAAWNASNPQAQVSVGDRIASCNGVEGDSRAILAELKRAEVCALVLHRS